MRNFARPVWLPTAISIGVITAALIGTPFAAPIRVGILTGQRSGSFWVTSNHTAANTIISILANPDSSNLGPNLAVYQEEVIVTRFGRTGTTQGKPTPDEVQAFIDALDTTDVVVLVNNIDMGNIFSDSVHRQKLEAYSRTHGVLSHHHTLDTYGTWAAWDLLQGARFLNHPSSDRSATVHLDSVAESDPHYLFLNRGLPDTARFLEEWFSFSTSGAAIRSNAGLNVTVRVDEASYQGGLGGAPEMGADHPLSWYRTFPEGGRFFYTAIGHRPSTLLGTGTASTPEAAYFFRRQLYNAILWAAKVDSLGYTTSIGGDKVDSRSPSRFADHARLSLSGGSLTVSLLRDGAHSVEIRGLDGRRVAMRTNAQRGEYDFNGLPSGVHLIAIRTASGTATQLVRIP
jgi:type 1 glutamine amidotransferase